MFKSKIILTLFILGTIFSGCKDETKKAQTQQKAQTKNENQFILKDTNANKIIIEKTDKGYILKDNPDKIIIFDIFATWCPPCRAEAEVLSNIQKKYQKKVKVIGITIEKSISNEKLQNFIDTYSVKYTLVNSDENSRLTDDISKNLKIGERFPIPMVAIYNKGKLVTYYLGATEEEFIDTDIKAELGQLK